MSFVNSPYFAPQYSRMMGWGLCRDFKGYTLTYEGIEKALELLNIPARVCVTRDALKESLWRSY